MTWVYVYTWMVICTKGQWSCLPEHNFYANQDFHTIEECYRDAERRLARLVRNGWITVCVEGRKIRDDR